MGNKFEDGFSLIQVMVAGAIAAGLGLVLMNYGQQQKKIEKTAAMDLEMRGHIDGLFLHLRNREMCALNFGTLDRDGDGTPETTGLTVGVNRQIPEVVDADGITLINPNNLTPPFLLNQFTVSRIEVVDWNPDLKLFNLAVTYNRKSPTTSFGSATKTRDYPIRYSTRMNGANVVVAGCTSSLLEDEMRSEINEMVCSGKDPFHYWDPEAMECKDGLAPRVVPNYRMPSDRRQYQIYDCPRGYVATGMSVRHGGSVDQLTLLCRRFEADPSNPKRIIFVDSGNSPSVPSKTVGIKGNDNLEISECPSGQVIKRLRWNARTANAGGCDETLTNLKVFCSTSLAGPGGSELAQFGNDGNADESQEAACGSGEFLTGIVAKFNAENNPCVYKYMQAICSKVVTLNTQSPSGGTNSSGGTSGSGASGASGASGGSGGGCFIAGTQIEMASGELKNIEDVVVGDQLLDGMKNKVTVRKLKRFAYDGEIYSINGGGYFFTPNHPFLSLNGWKSLDPETSIKESKIVVTRMKIGDILLKKNGLEIIYSLDSISANETVYNFTVSGTHEYIANDYFVHNVEKEDNGNIDIPSGL